MAIAILIADDHPTFREGLRRLLEVEGDLQVTGIASDGLEAARLAEDMRPDVAIVDIAMPNLNGIDAIKMIRKASPNTAVIVLSAYDYDSYVLPALESGAMGYLLKTMGVASIVGAVRAVHAGQTILDFAVHRRLMSRIERTSSKAASEGRLPLSRREVEVLALVARGLHNRAVADVLVISERTVQTHFRNILRKLGVKTRTQAVARATKEALIPGDELS